MLEPLFRSSLFIVFLVFPFALFAQTGDAGSAELFVRGARRAIEAERWSEALSSLEEAAGYRDVSSDLGYLLALARHHEGKPSSEVLEALNWAEGTNRWTHYSGVECLLLEAEVYVETRGFSEALATLNRVPAGADAAVLRLRALKGLHDANVFRRFMAETLDLYPEDSRPAHILFEYLREDYLDLKIPEENERKLVDTVLSRLSFLAGKDPELIPVAVSFINDTEEARRVMEAYRAGTPRPSSIPAALNLGLIDESEALKELFTGENSSNVSFRLLNAVWDLLRTDEGREEFRQNLLSFSGIITEDRDRDGRPETFCVYRNGFIQKYNYDADQDGSYELELFFGPLNNPERARLNAGAGKAARQITVFWSRYPAVERVEITPENTVYIPRPGDFFYKPVNFTGISGKRPFQVPAGAVSGLLYPQLDAFLPRLSEKTLVSFALTVKRPSAEFPGAEEITGMNGGIIRDSVEYLKGRVVSRTVFLKGRPVSQVLDLDLDGRMETRRYFLDSGGIEGGEDRLPWDYPKILSYSESDWDGDGIFESAESYKPDETIIRSWDTDKDGIREIPKK